MFSFEHKYFVPDESPSSITDTHDEQPTDQLHTEPERHTPSQKSLDTQSEPQYHTITLPQIPRHHPLDIHRPSGWRHHGYNRLAHNRTTTAPTTRNTRRWHSHARSQHPHRLRIQSKSPTRKMHSRSSKPSRRRRRLARTRPDNARWLVGVRFVIRSPLARRTTRILE